MQPPLQVPVMRRWCEPGAHWVLDCDAQILRVTVTGSGPGVPVYACHQDIRDRGLIPAAAFIGHRSTAPEHAPRPV